MSSNASFQKASQQNRLVEVTCPVCDSSVSKKLFDVKDWNLKCDNREFSLCRCSQCGCGYLSPRPSENEMSLYYPPEFYWQHENSKTELDWEDIIRQRSQQLKDKAIWFDGIPPGRLLDVGAQKGEFLWFMQQRGWVAEGIELENNVPNPAGMPIRYGDFLEMSFEDKTYDVITLWAVLEHVYQPSRFIERAASLLKDGGKLIVLVTNLNSIQGRLHRRDDYPRHLTIFTKKSVNFLCEKYGLRVDRISTEHRVFRTPLNGGLVYALKRMGGYSPEELFAEWKQREDRSLFYTKWRGKPSAWVLNVSRIDYILSQPIEFVLDKLGFGHTLAFSAVKA